MSSSIDFTKQFIVYGHGVRDIKENPEETTPNSHFILNPNYRVVTLHIPGKKIKDDLVKIILNKISKKSSMINDLFIISCPIARGICKKRLEDELIKEYFYDKFAKSPSDTSKMLELIIPNYIKIDEGEGEDFNYEELNIKNIEDLNLFFERNLDEMKKSLNFEIRLYRPGELCPKLRIDFVIYNSLSKLKGGIFNINTFENFDLDDYQINNDADNYGLDIDTSVEQKINSLVDFKPNFQYVFDESDVSRSRKSFFNTIRETVPTGTLIVLSCGNYSNSVDENGVKHKTIQLVRRNSLERQNATFRKYVIKYE